MPINTLNGFRAQGMQGSGPAQPTAWGGQPMQQAGMQSGGPMQSQPAPEQQPGGGAPTPDQLQPGGASGSGGTRNQGSLQSQYQMGVHSQMSPTPMAAAINTVPGPSGVASVGQTQNNLPPMQQQSFDPTDPNNAALAGYAAAGPQYGNAGMMNSQTLAGG